jgi:hypothetical protein
MLEYSRTFNIQAYQLAEALHDKAICPYSHRETSQKYVPRDECPRIPDLTARALELLLNAYDQPFKVVANGKTYKQTSLNV